MALFFVGFEKPPKRAGEGCRSERAEGGAGNPEKAALLAVDRTGLSALNRLSRPAAIAFVALFAYAYEAPRLLHCDGAVSDCGWRHASRCSSGTVARRPSGNVVGAGCCQCPAMSASQTTVVTIPVIGSRLVRW